MILSTIQNAGEDVPFDRMLAHIAQIFPGQGFAKLRGNFFFAFQLILRNIRPHHHIGNQLLHIHDRRNKQSLRNTLFGKSNSQKIWQSMLDDSMMEEVSKAGGVGLADMIYKQLTLRKQI